MRDDLINMLQSITTIRAVEGNLIDWLTLAMAEDLQTQQDRGKGRGGSGKGILPRSLPPLGAAERKVVESILGGRGSGGDGGASRLRRPSAEDFVVFSSAPFRLSPRELQVLTRVFSGMGNKEIARELEISPRTVEAHRSNLMQKFGAVNAAQLVQMVWETLAGPLPR